MTNIGKNMVEMFAVDPDTMQRLRSGYVALNDIQNDPLVRTVLQLKQDVPRILNSPYLAPLEKQRRYALAANRLNDILATLARDPSRPILDTKTEFYDKFRLPLPRVQPPPVAYRFHLQVIGDYHSLISEFLTQ